MRNSLLLLCSVIVSMSLPSVVHAQESKSPVQVEADETLEWDRDNSRYIARGHATAKQDNMSLQGDTLIADYREGSGGNSSMQIYKITAEENVVLSSADQQAFGDHLVYDLETGVAVLTGEDLHIATPTDRITAEDRIEYYDKDQTLFAVGKAVATRENQTLNGDVLEAYFTENANGETVIERIIAKGNVKISTDQETVTGSHGVYNPKANTAEVTGNVVIKRGQNIVRGVRAETDLTTQVSTVYAGRDSGGKNKRVTGTFLPGSFSKDK